MMMRKTIPIVILSFLLGVPLTARSEGSYTIGLSMYSLRQLFQSGELTALEYPKFVKKTYGIEKVDTWYGGFPEGEVDNPAFYRELKKAADREGVEIFLHMAGVLDVRKSDLAILRENAESFFVDIDRAVLLGATYLRIFLRAPNGDRSVALSNAVASLEVLAEYARVKGIVLVIEPGASDWTKDGSFLADVAKSIDHPFCKLMPDFGKVLDPYLDTIAMMPHAAVVSAKTHDIYDGGKLEHFDYPRLMKIVKDAGFSGIVAIEYEGKNLGPVEGVRATQKILEELNK